MNLRGWRARRQERLQASYRAKVGQMQGELSETVLRFGKERTADRHPNDVMELIGQADALIAFHERTPAIMTQLQATTRSVTLVSLTVVIAMLAVVGATVDGAAHWVWVLLAVPTLLVALGVILLSATARLAEPASELQADRRVGIGTLAVGALGVTLLALGVLPGWWLVWVLPFIAWSTMRLFDGILG